MSIKKTTQPNGTRRQQEKHDLEVMDIDDDDGEGTSTALYGRSGSGKTTLSATWPKSLLYLDIRDRGARSIRDVKGIKRRRIRELDELDETYWWLKDNPEAYNSVVLDTVSQLQSMTVDELSAGKRRGKGRRPGDWGTLTQRDWADVSARMKEYIINFRDLVDEGMHVVFIAQDRTFNLTDEEADAEDMLAPEIGPQLSPATAKVLNAAVDVIGNTFIRTRMVPKKEGKGKEEKIDYCLRVGPNSLYVTKVRKPRSSKTPSLIVDPDYEDILAMIEGENR